MTSRDEDHMASTDQLHRLEIAYADHRDNRMIIIGAAAWPTLAEQEQHFAVIPAVEDSDFIVDFYDAEGCITKDKCIAGDIAAFLMGAPLATLIRRGRRLENALTKRLQNRTPAKDPTHD